MDKRESAIIEYIKNYYFECEKKLEYLNKHIDVCIKWGDKLGSDIEDSLRKICEDRKITVITKMCALEHIMNEFDIKY